MTIKQGDLFQAAGIVEPFALVLSDAVESAPDFSGAFACRCCGEYWDRSMDGFEGAKTMQARDRVCPCCCENINILTSDRG